MELKDIRKDIYRDYNLSLRPLLILVESIIEKFPIGLLNEVRAINDHIARTYCIDLSKSNKEKELKNAKRHITRAKLDCYKILLVQSEKNVERFLKDYRSIRLGEVDSGKFYPKFTKLLNDARKLVGKAKEQETKGLSRYNSTTKFYNMSFLKYNELKEFIEKNADNLTWSVCNNRIRIIITSVISFIVSLIAGFITGLALYFLLYL